MSVSLSVSYCLGHTIRTMPTVDLRWVHGALEVVLTDAVFFREPTRTLNHSTRRMPHGKYLSLYNRCRRSAFSSVFYFAMNLPDGWLDRTIGRKPLQYCLRSLSTFITREIIELMITNLIKSPCGSSICSDGAGWGEKFQFELWGQISNQP